MRPAHLPSPGGRANEAVPPVCTRGMRPRARQHAQVERTRRSDVGCPQRESRDGSREAISHGGAEPVSLRSRRFLHWLVAVYRSRGMPRSARRRSGFHRNERGSLCGPQCRDCRRSDGKQREDPPSYKPGQVSACKRQPGDLRRGEERYEFRRSRLRGPCRGPPQWEARDRR